MLAGHLVKLGQNLRCIAKYEVSELTRITPDYCRRGSVSTITKQNTRVLTEQKEDGGGDYW